MAEKGNSKIIIVAVLAFLAGAFVGNAVTVMTMSTGSGGTAHQAQTPAQMPSQAPTQDQSGKLVQAVKNHPEDPRAWTALGNHYFDHDRPGKAVEAYQKALELDPSKPGVWSDLGVMYRRTGKPQKAIEAFDKAMELDPIHITPLFNKGIVLFYDLERPQEAAKTWRRVLEIDPEAKAPNGMPVREFIKMALEKQ
ncbi:tetratricopeptide repeat protein [Desulfovibrio oxyclinae]|uniref:tetratricopeptide repeat protein n=1 Tax=Desulfovibrio oxyclinae TaxID=63560 RepID=UPI000376D5F0|nr:tetratricopeptide repeat protein [Desulfovibrio oxyclinae]